MQGLLASAPPRPPLHQVAGARKQLVRGVRELAGVLQRVLHAIHALAPARRLLVSDDVFTGWVAGAKCRNKDAQLRRQPLHGHPNAALANAANSTQTRPLAPHR